MQRTWVSIVVVIVGLGACREPRAPYTPPPGDAAGDALGDAGDALAPDAAGADPGSADAGPDDLAPRFDIPPCEGCDPTVQAQGAPDRLRLLGMVVTPWEAFEGEVLVVGERLACVAPSCADHPDAVGATVVATRGVIAPGLIDAHNHILFDAFDADDWTPTRRYEHHDQWPQEASYDAMKAAVDHLLASEASGGVDLDCELQKYGELKALLTGTTSVLGAAKGAARKCYASLARSIDTGFNDLPDTARPAPCTAPADNDHVRTAIGLPANADVPALLADFDSCHTWAWVVHLAEGVPASTTAHNEWLSLLDRGLDQPQTTLIHGTALGGAEFAHMIDAGMKLVWSPASNLFLYGETTRLDEVVAAEQAAGEPLTVALAPDWSLGGSPNLLAELKVAAGWDANAGGVLGHERLVRMVTTDAAHALEVHDQVGALQEGLMADLIVVTGDPTAPFASLVAARPQDVRLVMVGGQVLTGDLALAPLAPRDDCETVSVCGRERFVCVAEPSGADKLDQTLAEIEDALSNALQAYDAVHGTSFAPLAPLVPCP